MSMGSLQKQVFLNGLNVTMVMTDLENVKTMEDFDKLNEEFCRRVRVWRGSILCRLMVEKRETIDE